MTTRDALLVVIEAAERRKSELLEQASKYERLGQPTVAAETMRDHYDPLKRAVHIVRERYL